MSRNYAKRSKWIQENVHLDLIEADGLRFQVRPYSTDIETIEENILQKHYFRLMDIDPEDFWIDLGAYIGTFALPVRRVGAGVLAVEPEKGSHALLLQNQALNGLQFSVLQVAVEEAPTKRLVRLYTNTVDGDLFSSSTLYHRWKRKRRPFQIVHCLGFSEILSFARGLAQGKRICIKADIEGSEIEILEALDSSDRIAKLALEYHFAKDPSLSRLRKIVKRLRSFGYLVKTDRKIPPVKEWKWFPPHLRLFAWLQK